MGVGLGGIHQQRLHQMSAIRTCLCWFRVLTEQRKTCFRSKAAHFEIVFFSCPHRYSQTLYFLRKLKAQLIWSFKCLSTSYIFIKRVRIRRRLHLVLTPQNGPRTTSFQKVATGEWSMLRRLCSDLQVCCSRPDCNMKSLSLQWICYSFVQQVGKLLNSEHLFFMLQTTEHV